MRLNPRPQRLHNDQFLTRTSLIYCIHKIQLHQHTATISSLSYATNLPESTFVQSSKYSPCQHISIFQQLLNPERLNDVSGRVTSCAFIICLVGSAPVSRVMQASGAVTITPIAQVSSSYSLYATCWENSCSLYLCTLHLQEKRGVKRSAASFSLLFTVV